jgi:hypothetical protein
MNKKRRKRLALIGSALDAELTGLRELAEEERAAYDNLPESVQGGERGQAIEAMADTLDELVEKLDEVVSDIGGIA